MHIVKCKVYCVGVSVIYLQVEKCEFNKLSFIYLFFFMFLLNMYKRKGIKKKEKCFKF